MRVFVYMHARGRAHACKHMHVQAHAHACTYARACTCVYALHAHLFDGPLHKVSLVRDDERDETGHETFSVDHDLVDVGRASVDSLNLLRSCHREMKTAINRETLKRQ